MNNESKRWGGHSLQNRGRGDNHSGLTTPNLAEVEAKVTGENYGSVGDTLQKFPQDLKRKGTEVLVSRWRKRDLEL